MRRLALMLALGCVLAAPSAAQSLEERLDLARLAAQIELALAGDEALAPFTFDAVVRGEAIALRGRVLTRQQRERVAEVAQQVRGVRSVVNEVEVSPEADRPKRTPEAMAEVPRAPEPDTAAADVPGPEAEPEPEPEPEPVYHTVRRGDTLTAIARQHGTSVRALQQLNNLSGSRIRIGQRLRVK
ncbi:MAG: LysM peptidoglycan-binding domain-containing protein [Rhodothermales bacterium]|nr:LysM peptidoglycan-binding domain-containing protein [Rhodothermales bacterium]